MSSSRLIQWGGLAAMFGAILWIGVLIALAARPEGWIAAECELPGRSMRDWSGPGPFFVAALLFVLIGLTGLVVRVWSAGCFGRVGRMGLVSSIIGVITLLVAGLIQPLFFAGDFPLVLLFVISGILALVVALLCVGIAILQTQVLPHWAAWLLILAAIAMLGFNDQNKQVLMAVPLGIAWGAVGYVLWSEKAVSVQPEPALSKHR